MLSLQDQIQSSIVSSGCVLHGLKGRSKRSIWWRCLRIQKRCSGLGQTRKLHLERKAWLFGIDVLCRFERCSALAESTWRWELRSQDAQDLQIGTCSLTSHIFSFDPRKFATWTCQSTSNRAASSWRGATWLANVCVPHFCRAGLACAIWLRVVADSDWSRTGDFAAYDIYIYISAVICI